MLSGRGGRDPEVFSGQEVSSGRGGQDSEGVVSSGKVLSGREVLSGKVLSGREVLSGEVLSR